MKRLPDARSLARGLLGLAGFALATVVIFWAVFALLDLRQSGRVRPVVIGSKADTEGVLLSAIMAELIEQETGESVERRSALGGTSICFEALRAGEIDLYPEYTGTALVALLKQPVVDDARRAYEIVRDELERRDRLVMLEPLAFDNTYALAMTERRAQALGIDEISDLSRHPDLTAGFTAEFMGREDGWPGLRRRYGLAPREQPRSMEAGLMYGAVAAGEVDVIGAYATDGRIDKFSLRVLKDDKRFFPPYQAAPLIRRAALEARPAIAAALRPLAGKLSDAEMRRLNAEVDIQRRDAGEVAREFVRNLMAR
jgi:glycine betaine/choline ABC-type transport system substrate-binding protein